MWVLLGGALMAIGPWPRGCPEVVEGSGVIQEAQSRVIRDFSKGQILSRNPYQSTLRKLLIFWPSQDHFGVKISPIIKVPKVQSLKVTPLGTIVMRLGVYPGGGPEKLNSGLGGPWGG